MSDYTFDVDHHGRSTDSVLVRDEISKAAYRAAKAWEQVASTELAETRSECYRLREQIKAADELAEAASNANRAIDGRRTGWLSAPLVDGIRESLAAYRAARGR